MDGPISAVRRFGFLVGAVVAGAFCATSAHGQVTNVYGIDLMTIGSPGNAPYVPDRFADYANTLPPDPNAGFPPRPRPYGGVAYSFGIGRTEITTVQWLDFVNTFSVQSFELRNFAEPSSWAAVPDSSYSGPGARYRLSTLGERPADVPVFGISWRGAAMYCNWLHNDRSADIASIMNGAYDVSTFGNFNGGGDFHDQLVRTPGARFWIPNVDEWVKATFWDPNRNGEGQGGYWTRHYSRDEPLVYGPPGIGMANAGFETDLNSESHYIPTGSYPEYRSPWGLLDTAGSTREWLENAYGTYPDLGITGDARFVAASGAGTTSGIAIDQLEAFGRGSVLPNPNFFVSSSYIGFRIASNVPSAGSASLLLCSVVVFVRRRRR